VVARSAATPRLHGRRGELEQLEAWLGHAGSGAPQTVIVEGEAGIGKSSLLEATLARARERGFRVLAGRADEVERARPFGPLLEALGALAGSEVRRLLTAGAGEGPIEPTGDPGLQFRVVDLLVGAVEEAALAGPLAVAVEDLHWADASTRLTLRSLSRRIAYLPVALLTTLRPLPRPHELERLLEALVRDGAHELVLEPLDERAVTALVAELVGAVPPPALLTKVRGAAGNPLFVTELVKAVEAEGTTDAVDASLPPSLRLTILRRLGFLGEEAIEVLRLASLLGSAFSLRDLAAVLGRAPPELLRPVREAVRAGVLEERESRLHFRHDLIREAVYEDLPADVRATLHVEAARRLAAAGAPPLQVAEQFARGARRGDADAISWLHVAGREAARRDPVLGAELLETALELAHERAPILADVVPPLLWSGRPQAAETRAREALATSPPPELEGPVRLGLVRALAAQGRHRALVDEVGSALTGPLLGADIRSELQAQAANALEFLGDLDGCEAAARDAVATGTPARSEGAELGLLVLSDAARDRGRLDDSLAYAEEALRRAEARGAVRLQWRPGIFLAMALRGLDRFDDAQDAIRRARDADERAGNASYLPVYHYESASELFLAGRWDEAVAEAEAGLALADEVGLQLLLHWPHGLLARIAVHRDDLDAADAWLAGPAGGADAVVAQGLLAEARGDSTAALAALRDAWERDLGRGILSGRRLLGPDLVRLALAEGDPGLAAAVAAGVAEAAAHAAVASLEGAALRCHGLAESDAGLLVRSVEAYRRGPRAFERARACEDAATALARAGRTGEARAIFDEALDVYDEVGARRDAARALAAMRGLGIGRKRRGARKRPERGWEALTPSELEVVKLAAAGLTNPEIGRRLFVSPRTVQTHLKHAFQKLDIGSRVQLAAEAARRGDV
jgi:DNA-binding CsgD family transcriptional regulator